MALAQPKTRDDARNEDSDMMVDWLNIVIIWQADVIDC
jgi:hypothetical protein